MKTRRRRIGLVGISVLLALAAVITVRGSTAASSAGKPAAFPPEGPAFPPEGPGDGSVLPSQAQTMIPLGSQADVDASCGDYTDGASFEFSDAFGVTGTVFLKHDADYLYVCMEGSPGQNPDRYARVYLDTDHGQEAAAEADDLALQVDITEGTESSYRGTGVADGYEDADIPGWMAEADQGTADVAEWAIPLHLTGGWCGTEFGLAVYHHAVSVQGDDYGWPSNEFYDVPESWMSVVFESAPCGDGDIAYVFWRDLTTANDFETMLENEGFSVELIPLAAVANTSFGRYDLIIIADDTGDLDVWGTGPGQVTPIASAAVPILGLGEGGYAFFGQLGSPIGWPNGWHGPMDQVLEADPSLPHYMTPYNLNALLPGPFPVYKSPVNEVGIYLSQGILPQVEPIGLEPPSQTGEPADHASVIADQTNPESSWCYQLWGFSGGPTEMNVDGSQLFVNTVVQGRTSLCARPTEPLPCVTLQKSASPPDGTVVQPGDTIRYTLSYTVSPNCPDGVLRARLFDPLPEDTLFVPGSGSGGATPNADDVLVWDLGTLSAGSTGSESFAVSVMDTQCTRQRQVNNSASLKSSEQTAHSNLVSHPVECPPIGFPNEEPPYAESEIQIHPYPLVTGHRSEVSVKVSNLGATAQVLTVSFQTSPSRFGIGLDYSSFDTKVVTVPAESHVIVRSSFTPVSSGHYCIQVKVEGVGFEPIYTQKNLDVTEDLQAGVEDVLTFSVGNPTATEADVSLTVDNTCPGWTAWVSPTLLTDVGPDSGDIRQVDLHVIPPLFAPLGTACHIDVQAWISGRLVGGLRKLDVPPVHLPRDVDPPWMEPEITLDPSPPIVGQPTDFCIELQNPLGFTRTVTVIYEVADFGAGIWFTEVATRTLELPPNSIDDYCATWTPSAGGTLHRCLQVVLRQPGFEDQTSQKNIDIEEVSFPSLDLSEVLAVIRNPHLMTQTLELRPTTYGIGPMWKLDIRDAAGGPVPPVLGPEGTVGVRVGFTPIAGAADVLQQGSPHHFGDESRVEIEAFVGGTSVGGFSAVYEEPRIVYLPLVVKGQ